MISKGTTFLNRLLPCAWMFSLFLVTFVSAYPVFWEQEISAALDSRDSYYKSAGISPAFFLNARSGKSVLPGPESLVPDTISPWYYFLRGLTAGTESAETASLYFTKAVACTEKDPGRTWVLCSEFGRCGLYAWHERCLKKLELLLLASGAQSAPAVAQALLYGAAVPDASRNGPGQEFFGAWSQKFDRDNIWPPVIKVESDGLPGLFKAMPQLQEVLGKIAGSWYLQLVVSRHVVSWLLLVLLISIAGVLAGIAAKHLPAALHLSSEHFPELFSLQAKQILAFCVFCSLALLGVVPFLWIFFFLVWRHCAGRDKFVLWFAFAAFLLAPLGIRVGDMFDRPLAPDGPVMLYKKSIDEGYYYSLDSCISAQTRRNNRDVLLHTAAAQYKLKKGDPSAAYPHIRLARMYSPDNPVVIMTEGNVMFYNGDLAGARNAFQECINRYPDYGPAYFNLGQYFFNSMETTKGMEHITQATRLNPGRINAFIKKNDECFSKEWPQLRQLITPDFTPSQFWSVMFPSYCGSWKTAGDRSGGLFFGLPLLWYCAVSVALLALLLILNTAVWTMEVAKKVSTCKLCQAPICRSCKRGGICKDCFNATQQIRNEQIRQRIMGKIQQRNFRFRSTVARLLTMVFPGAGLVYKGAPAYQSIPLVFATSAVYASYVSLLHATSAYPAWTFQGLIVPLYVLLVSYNVFFIVRTIMKSVKDLKRRSV